MGSYCYASNNIFLYFLLLIIHADPIRTKLSRFNFNLTLLILMASQNRNQRQALMNKQTSQL